MAKRIPLTNFTKYMTEAQAIGRNLRESAGSPETVRQAVMDLTDLAVKSLEEAAQVFEGLALVVLSQHPAVNERGRGKNAFREPRRPRGPESVGTKESVARRAHATGEGAEGLDGGVGGIGAQ